MLQGNGRRYDTLIRTSVLRLTSLRATSKPTTRATTFAAAAPSTPRAGSVPTPPMSAALAAMLTAFIAKLAFITSPVRAWARNRAVNAKNTPCSIVVEPTTRRNDEAMPCRAGSMLSREKNCGQNANSTAVIRPANTAFTTSAKVAISETERERSTPDPPRTRVTSTVDAVPIADNAMVTMLRICKALPTAAAGCVPRGASMNWLTLPIMICMNSSTNNGMLKASTSLGAVLSAGVRAARSVRTARTRAWAPCAKAAMVIGSMPSFPSTGAGRAVYGTSTEASLTAPSFTFFAFLIA